MVPSIEPLVPRWALAAQVRNSRIARQMPAALGRDTNGKVIVTPPSCFQNWKRGRSRRASEESALGSEQETEADLDLAAGVGKIAVGFANRAKGRVKRERGGSASAAHEVTGAVDAGDVLMVENVESFPESFDGVVVAKLDALGKAQIHVDGALHLECIAADDVDAFAAVGAVDATTERSVGDGG